MSFDERKKHVKDTLEGSFSSVCACERGAELQRPIQKQAREFNKHSERYGAPMHRLAGGWLRVGWVPCPYTSHRRNPEPLVLMCVRHTLTHTHTHTH